jgi:hypothetical protein
VTARVCADRALAIGERVRVHKNLQRGDWSVTVGGVVVASVDRIVLADVTFRYWVGGRERVLASAASGRPRRRVCAWAEGVVAALPADTLTRVLLHYDPYESAEFRERATGRSVRACEYVEFTAGAGAIACGRIN